MSIKEKFFNQINIEDASPENTPGLSKNIMFDEIDIERIVKT